MDLLMTAAAWMPALIFPAATFSQLLTVWRASDRSAVRIPTWSLFGFANLGALVLAAPDGSIAWLQAGVGFGVTAVLDLLIVIVAASRIGIPDAAGTH